MACVICGLDRRTRDPLVKIEASLEPVGNLCYGCLEQLRRNRPTRLGCGFKLRENACQNDGAYATTTTTGIDYVGNDSSRSVTVPEDPLICEEHFELIQEGEAKPEWL